MAKLYFRYGAMNSGKSTALLQAAFNYRERGQRVLLVKPALDTKARAHIVSRLGISAPVDILVHPSDDVGAAVRAVPTAVACVLVDEAQFLTPVQVEQLFRLATEDAIPVIAYGIRSDFRTRAFPGSARLLTLAHSLEELKTICRCGRKAICNARGSKGTYVFEGEQIAIDEGQVTYEALCGQCYLTESGGRLGGDFRDGAAGLT